PPSRPSTDIAQPTGSRWAANDQGWVRDTPDRWAMSDPSISPDQRIALRMAAMTVLRGLRDVVAGLELAGELVELVEQLGVEQRDVGGDDAAEQHAAEAGGGRDGQVALAEGEPARGGDGPGVEDLEASEDHPSSLTAVPAASPARPADGLRRRGAGRGGARPRRPPPRPRRRCRRAAGRAAPRTARTPRASRR